MPVYRCMRQPIRITIGVIRIKMAVQLLQPLIQHRRHVPHICAHQLQPGKADGNRCRSCRQCPDSGYSHRFIFRSIAAQSDMEGEIRRFCIRPVGTYQCIPQSLQLFLGILIQYRHDGNKFLMLRHHCSRSVLPNISPLPGGLLLFCIRRKDAKEDRIFLNRTAKNRPPKRPAACRKTSFLSVKAANLAPSVLAVLS